MTGSNRFRMIQATLAALFSFFVISPVIGAELIREHSLQIAIDDGSDDGILFVDLDVEPESIDLLDLQLGEARSIVDHNGRPVLITRTESGIDLNIDGQQIELPQLDKAMSTGIAFARDKQNIGVTMTKQVIIDGSEGVTIISGKGIDQATREGIRSLLLSAGHDGEISFVDSTPPHSEL